MSISTESAVSSRYFRFGEDFSEFELPQNSFSPMALMWLPDPWERTKDPDYIVKVKIQEKCVRVALEARTGRSVISNYLLSDAYPTRSMKTLLPKNSQAPLTKESGSTTPTVPTAVTRQFLFGEDFSGFQFPEISFNPIPFMMGTPAPLLNSNDDSSKEKISRLNILNEFQVTSMKQASNAWSTASSVANYFLSDASSTPCMRT